MKQNMRRNRQWLLGQRPHGRPTPENFQFNEAPVPEPQDGELLLRTVYLSLDPYMRGRMDAAESYAAPVELGAPMVGGTVCRVAGSRHPDFQTGDWVLSYSGWQDYAISGGAGLLKLPETIPQPSYALGILGMPAFTAYMGLTDIGRPQPGETVCVAAATGPVGATVGQIAKILGCRAIGIAGGREKCDFAVETLGFDACIDRYAEDFAARLDAACPDGIDVYYENVGGKVFDAILPRLNAHARIPLCGLIAHYNQTELPPGPDRLSLLMGTLLKKRITMRGFIIFDDYGERFPDFLAQMGQWLKDGRIHYREDLREGFANIPQALIDLLDGKNFGKLVVQIGEP